MQLKDGTTYSNRGCFNRISARGADANTKPPEVGKTCDPWILKAALKASFGQRLIDLFREWDADDSNEISKVEFRQACTTAIPLKKWWGIPGALKEEIDKTFEYFDRDGSGDERRLAPCEALQV